MDIGVKAFVVFEGKILLILRDNIPTIPFPDFWNLPGGGVEEGEDFDTALRRELVEEIGVIPADIVRMGTESFDDNRTVIRYLVCLDTDEVGQLKLGDEGQEMRFFEFGEILKLPVPPYLGDFVHKNKEYLKMIIEDGAEIIPEKLGLTS